MTSAEVVRQDADFVCEGRRCAAWLYRPQTAEPKPLPIVVMAHGFAGQRSFRLPEYAAKFAGRGLAVLLFDYRHFGDSEGEPRNLVDHRRQHRDWLAAIEHVKTIAGIDGDRIGLWGSSFSGGHVVGVAAGNPEVQAIASQAPMLDMVRSLRVGATFAAAALWHGMRDYGRAMSGRTPHYIPTVASPNQFAALNQVGCESGYRALVEEGSPWSNQCTARSLLSSLFFRPCRKAAQVHCPALFVIAEQDQVIRSRVIEKIAAKIRRAEVIRFSADHFEIYQGDLFEEISERQADFFVRHLHP